MEEVVFVGERGRQGLTTAVGGTGSASSGTGGPGRAVGRGGRGADTVEDLPPAMHRHPQLRRKSVSFTGEETYQVMRGSDQPVNRSPTSKGVSDGSGKLASQSGVAPASAFFLRANQTISPMVTPHAAYAAAAENSLPLSASSTTRPTPASMASEITSSSSLSSSLSLSLSSSSSSSSFLAPGPTAPCLYRGSALAGGGAPSSPYTTADNGLTAFSTLAGGGHQPLPPHYRQQKTVYHGAGGKSTANATPAQAQPSTTLTTTAAAAPSAAGTYGSHSRNDGNGCESAYLTESGAVSGGFASSDSGNFYGGNGNGDSSTRYVEQARFFNGRHRGADADDGYTQQGRAREREMPSLSQLAPADAANSEDSSQAVGSTISGRKQCVLSCGGGELDRRYVSEDSGGGNSRELCVAEVGGEEWEKFLPGSSSAGVSLERGDIEEREEALAGNRVRGFNGATVFPPALERLERSPAAPYEDVIDREVEEEEEQVYEIGDNDVQESPYYSDDNCDARNDEATYSASGASCNKNGEPWSAVSESNTCSGPRPRGKRDSWDIGSRYRFIRILGHGSYGEVAKCEDLLEGGLVAVKRVLNVFNSEVDAKRIYREMYILRHMQHEEIIHLKDVIMPPAFEDFRDLYLVFEFVDTDLYKLIGSPQFLTDEHVKLFLYQMLIGLKYVHSAHVIHRDIKPANILLNEDCTVKICDFGLSRVVTQEPSIDDPTPPPATCVPSSSAGKLACSPVKPSALPSPEVASQLAAAGGLNGEGSNGEPGDGDEDGTSPESDEEDPPPQQTRILKRQLTKHVVTRWYRAPELILLQDYNNAVDMWSLGCILAELLSMQKESFPTSQERTALFPGKSCFPLSAEKPSSYSDALDQLNVIFDVIGTPSKGDIKDLGEVRQYLERLKYKPPLKLADKYPGASGDALELLSCMLRFDPARRISIDQALEHRYLESCRRPEREVTASVPITMEFENITTDKATLKRLVYEEVLHYHPETRRARAVRTSDSSAPSCPSQLLSNSFSISDNNTNTTNIDIDIDEASTTKSVGVKSEDGGRGEVAASTSPEKKRLWNGENGDGGDDDHQLTSSSASNKSSIPAATAGDAAGAECCKTEESGGRRQKRPRQKKHG